MDNYSVFHFLYVVLLGSTLICHLRGWALLNFFVQMVEIMNYLFAIIFIKLYMLFKTPIFMSSSLKNPLIRFIDSFLTLFLWLSLTKTIYSPFINSTFYYPNSSSSSIHQFQIRMSKFYGLMSCCLYRGNTHIHHRKIIFISISIYIIMRGKS